MRINVDTSGAGGSGSWGPSHQPTGADWRSPRDWVRRIALAVIVYSMLLSGWPLPVSIIVALVTSWIARSCLGRLDTAGGSRSPAGRILGSVDPLTAARAEAGRLGGGVYLGVDRRGGWRLAPAERAVLVLGPPRSGKTSAVLVPAVLAHAGPAVSASTKPDVMAGTVAARARLGEVWQFNPTAGDHSGAVRVLRWSPVSAARDWDGALLIARAMVAGAGVGTGTTDGTHWSRRATALLAAVLHAAALDQRGVDSVLDWVLRHELDEPGIVLERAGARLGCGVLIGLQNTEGRERSSICSAAADALDAYTSQAALDAATNPNFQPDEFVRSADAIYVHAAGEQQALAAPLVCGLLADIRRATYRAHRDRQLNHAVLMALDEVANIAPLAELPQIASEGGGQGLTLVAALQDLSQARARWGTAADGFLTLFASKLILPGIADSKTLEAVSLTLGEYDRQTVSTTRRPPRDGVFAEISRTVSTTRQRVLSPGEIANIPAGGAIHLDGVRWELLALTPGHRVEPWRTLTQLAAPQPTATRSGAGTNASVGSER